MALGYSNILTSQRAAGSSFASYTTAKTVINPTELVQLPPNWWYVGKMLRMTVIGGISNRVTGPDTTTFQLNMGSIAAFSSGAINLTTTAHTNIPFWAQCTVTCRTIGVTTAATLMGQWILEGQMFGMVSAADNAAGTGWAMGPNTAPAVGTGFDSTIANTLDFFVAQSFSGAGNGIQVQQYVVEELN